MMNKKVSFCFINFVIIMWSLDIFGTAELVDITVLTANPW